MIYAITNQISGHFFGYYEAANEAAALDKLAIEAGYSDYDQAVATVGGRGDLYLKEVADFRSIPAFIDLDEAVKHYATEGLKAEDVYFKLACGEIRLGTAPREVR